MISTHIHIIYVPGLGDYYDPFRRFFLRWWQRPSVTTELVSMTWYGGVGFETSYTNVMDAIDRAVADGKTVYIIGESAGATMALHVFSARRDVKRLVTLCGVTDPRGNVSPHIYARSPAFRESMHRLQDSLVQIDASRRDAISVVTAAADHVVSPASNTLQGARSLTLLSVGHLWTILLGLTLYRRRVIDELIG